MKVRNELRAQLKRGQIASGMIVGTGTPEVSYALDDVILDWIALS